jgi:hypothetical protein
VSAEPSRSDRPASSRVARDAPADSRAIPAAAGDLRLDVERALQAKLEQTLLGHELDLGLYVWNGHRLTGVPACAPPAEVARGIQSFRNRYRLAREEALARAVPLGFTRAAVVPDEDVREAIRQLDDRTGRVLARLFWPAVDGAARAALRSYGLASAQLRTALRQAARQPPSPEYLHACAVAAHCAALGAELGLAPAKPGLDALWSAAWEAWQRVLDCDAFFAGLSRPGFDLDAGSAAQLRAELPRALAEIHVALGGQHVQRGAWDACRRHVRYLRASGLDAAVVTAALARIARLAAIELIEPARSEAAQRLPAAGETAVREALEPVIGRALDVAEQAALRLRTTCGDVDLGRLGVFDALGEAVVAAVQQLAFDRDDRLRSLLYCALVEARASALPLSTQLAQSVLRSHDATLYHLYGDAIPEAPLLCWFVRGEPADPHVSVLVDLYKITEREPYQEGDRAGVRVRFAQTRVLVPRSVYAARLHAGEPLARPVAASALSPDQRRARQEADALEAGVPAKIAARTAARDVALAGEDEAARARLAGLAGEHAAECMRLQDEAAAAAARHAREVAHLDAVLARQLAERSHALEAERAVLLEVAHAWSQRLAGPRALWRLELPVTLAVQAALGLLLAALGVAPGGAGAAVAPEASALARGGLVGTLATGVGVAFAAACGLRVAQAKQATRSLEAISGRLAREHADLADEHRAQLHRLVQARDAAVLRAPRTLEELRQVIVADAERRRAEIHAACNADLTALRESAAARVAALRAESAAPAGAVTLDRAVEHPVVQSALRRGFRLGERPSAVEMEMTAEEVAEAARLGTA